ncbi:acid-sensing ion channel 5-like [Bolinopsis microptera]|uniref:acid-sensing ion channel 5-like n=1 Tax=Bolinopsis microptera TaxID=2820187 RepID=UPI00307A027A
MSDIREFSADTSAHGIKFIFESPRKLLKVFFLLLWIAFSIYACYIICTKILMFVNKPTGTKFEVVVDDNESEKKGIKFPTITVCSMNKVRKSYLENEENRLYKDYFNIIDQYNAEQAKELANRLNDPNDEMFAIRNETYESLFQNGGPSPNRLLKCMQKNQHCGQMESFMEKDEYGVPIDGVAHYVTMPTSSSGKCWRVNPQGTLRGKMGDYGALTLMFWADIQDYSKRSSDSVTHGFNVVFHDHETYGSTIFSGFLMSPGTYYKVDLGLRVTLRNKHKAESCNASLVNTTYGVYNEGACLQECKDRTLHERCGCVQVLPPNNEGKYKACSFEKWASCGLSTYLEWYGNYTNTEDKKKGGEENECVCDTACEEKNYEASISSATISDNWVDSVHKNVGGFLQGFSQPDYNVTYSTPDDIFKNLMVVEILFTSMQKTQVNEVITYDLGNLFGDVGGVLGLFLGASVFTIIEFILFCVISCAKYCCKATDLGWLELMP